MPKTASPVLTSPEVISIVGAREHNLQNLSLEIPRDELVVITGVSGSGKSTLAFDILFAEGQRRFLDSMSSYARQFVDQLPRPDVDLIAGLPPTVSIEQRNSRGGGKSTVATVTEIYHFLRLLFARTGVQFCPDCQKAVQPQTRDQLVENLAREIRRRGPLKILAPVVRNRKGFHTDVAAWAAQHGYSEIRADGKIYSTAQPMRLDRFREHDVEIVVATFGPGSRHSDRKALEAAADTALKAGGGTLLALPAAGAPLVFSTHRVCPGCCLSFQPLDPKMFSYNSAQGWCARCRGFGELFYLPDVDRGARADAIEESWFGWQEGQREICPECHGARLSPMARAVRLPSDFGRRSSSRAALSPGRGTAGITIDTFAQASVAQAREILAQLRFSPRDALIARDILPEIRERLNFLSEVGLGYLELGRSITTLSGGEGQRIRLAAQLGSTLSGVLYVLDEPTIGLHPRDNEQLLWALSALKARGNSLVVVEHDEATMRQAGHIIDLGPGAGVHGGKVVARGTLSELMAHPDSLTGACLRARKKYPRRGARRPVDAKTGGLSRKACPRLVLKRAAVHNLKNLTVGFPLNRFVVVTGVSGSGKSSLVRDCLLPAIRRCLDRPDKVESIQEPNGILAHFESIKAVYEVDQSPIGRTPRSIPATYVGFFDEIRQLFAQTPEARMRGYSASRFSFNSAQGRCPTCDGAGTIKLEMNFLPPAFVSCDTCAGTRFNPETLEIQFRGKTIADILQLSVAEAIDFFSAQAKILRPLQALRDTGLDYLKLGQTSPTLSGGEAQRLKLVTHLLSGLRDTPHLFEQMNRSHLFLLEEPTIGLHMADVERLVDVLQRLVDRGHSVIVIEHNLDLIAEADWVIDLGPEAGRDGGQIVAEGTPEEIAANRLSHTGRFLKEHFRAC